jgi:tRNA(Arg) A34 adenosine deaminase TadA
MENNNKKYMLDAIQLASNNVDIGGGPFAAVIVKNNKIIAAAANSVTTDNDPTAHAEVNAIRKACENLNTFDLSGCVIYTSCEPCPMCLGAIYWAHIDKVFYGNTKEDAKKIGFDDSFIYKEMELPLNKRKVKFEQLLHSEAFVSFDKWMQSDNKKEY